MQKDGRALPLKSFLFLALFLAAASGTAKAVQDTLQHHYSQSVFRRWPQWNPQESWKAKYKDWDGGERTPRFPGATTWLVALTDPWHFFGLVRTTTLLCAGLLAGLLASRARRPAAAMGGSFLLLYVVQATTFHVFYHYLLV
jgi:hypothetical protein